GAMFSHEYVFSTASDVGTYFKLNYADRLIATLPIFHVFALTVVVNAPLYRGASIILVPHFSPENVLQTIREQKATVFAGVPKMYNFIYQYPNGSKKDYKTIRLSIAGGSSLPVSLLENFDEKFDTRLSEG